METQHSQINLKNKNEWGSRGKEYIYTYGLFMSIYGRNQHSTVFPQLKIYTFKNKKEMNVQKHITPVK